MPIIISIDISSVVHRVLEQMYGVYIIFEFGAVYRNVEIQF